MVRGEKGGIEFTADVFVGQRVIVHGGMWQIVPEAGPEDDMIFGVPIQQIIFVRQQEEAPAAPLIVQ